MMWLIVVEVNLRARIMEGPGLKVQLETADVVEKPMTMAIAWHLVRNALNVAKRTISSLCAKPMAHLRPQ